MIIDLHLDLAMNVLEWNRDLRLPVPDINRREHGTCDKAGRAAAMVSLPELRRGNIGLVVATQIARYVAEDNPLPGWHAPEIAWAQTQGQLAWYKAMEEQGEMVMIRNRADLEAHLGRWEGQVDRSTLPVGYILSLEGADSMVNLSYLEIAYQQGLRALGPAHYGPGRYAHGTDATGAMGAAGLALLDGMDRLNMILDVTHLTDEAFWQALGHYRGPVWASHNNCRALVPHQRQFTDEQILALVARKAIIGVAMDAWMMVPGWVRGSSDPAAMGCNLDALVRHIDHICQLTGHAKSVAIGSDLDGGFGREQCPADLGSIADLRLLEDALKRKGFTAQDITGIMQGNARHFLLQALPPA